MAQLFTQYFLTDGIKATPEWKRSVAEAEAFSAFHEAAGQRLGEFSDATHLHEATTCTGLRTSDVVLENIADFGSDYLRMKLPLGSHYLRMSAD